MSRKARWPIHAVWHPPGRRALKTACGRSCKSLRVAPVLLHDESSASRGTPKAVTCKLCRRVLAYWQGPHDQCWAREGEHFERAGGAGGGA